MQNYSRFFTYAGGIFVLYFYFGILQEKVTRGKYSYEAAGEDGATSVVTEKFTFALTLVFVQCLVNYLVAIAFVTIWPQTDDKTPRLYYASMSMTYLLAMVCSNMALQWVPYPTQVVGKSAKPIPVMVLGVLLGKKSYPVRKYVFVFMIVLGIVMFMFKDKGAAKTQDSTVGVGEVLLVLSLLMDGLTGAIQERIRAEAKPSGVQMMKMGNAWGTFFLTIAIICTGEYVRFNDFMQRHPSVLYDLLLLGITSAMGQLFLYSMVSEFGPLVLSVVTTTRKFFTVLGSVVLFGNVLTFRQSIGTVIVFVALFLDAYYSKSAPKKK